MTEVKSRKIFVTGTDTGAGKTVVTLAFALSLIEHGRRVKVVKPIETGCRQECEDVALYREFLGEERVSNYLNYKYPAAPWTAARLEDKQIDFGEIVERLKNEDGDIVIIEGAGGLLVPITHNRTYLDLIIELDVPVLLVAGNKLGVINHTLLSTFVLGSSGLKAFVILNDLSDEDPILLEDNLFTIERFSQFPVIGRFPYQGEELRRERLIRGFQPLYHVLDRFLQDSQE